MCLIGVILYTDYYWEAEDTDIQGHPAQRDPAHGDPGSRIVVDMRCTLLSFIDAENDDCRPSADVSFHSVDALNL